MFVAPVSDVGFMAMIEHSGAGLLPGKLAASFLFARQGGAG